MAEEGWVVVGKKGKSSNNSRFQPGKSEEAGQAPFLGDCGDPSVCTKSIRLLTDQLRSSGFYLSLKASFAKSDLLQDGIHSIRCYGTGSPSTSLEARSQLALLPLLLELLSNGNQEVSVQVYDPVLTDVDKAVVYSIGGAVLSADAAMQHTCNQGVLFYMPHCDSSLYNEVLESNWSIAGLSRIYVLGNSFRHMEDRWSMPTFKRRVGRPHRVISLVEHGLVQEEALPGAQFAVKTAFNDTSLHWFVSEVLKEAPELFRSGTAM